MAAFATSYIKTEGTALTRQADVASMTGTNFSSWFRADEGTMFGEGAGLSTAGIRLFSIGQSSANVMYVAGTQSTVVAAGATQASFAYSPTAGVSYKQALAYKTNDFAAARDAVLATDAVGQIPTGVTQANIGSIEAGGTFTGSGHIRKVAYYPARLSGAQLQALTR